MSKSTATSNARGAVSDETPGIPLAERLRPHTLDDFVGQTHLIGTDGVLRGLLARKELRSLIFWGPPGCGKTTLAHVVAGATDATLHVLSAVLCGIDDLRKLVAQIRVESSSLFRTTHIVFIDEIHRWNKAQQDALLPHVESGLITLIGATTENPSFEIIAPLLSRCTVVTLHALGEAELTQIAGRALAMLRAWADDDARATLVRAADGDARRLCNLVELAVQLRSAPTTKKNPLCAKDVDHALSHQPIRYDKKGEEHYNIISAFIKSMRGSDVNAALYYLARMYEAGEDPRFIARRMVIFASEDVSNADPRALQIAVAAFHAYEIVGHAEGWIPLAHAASYLALTQKSNASYAAYSAAKADVEHFGALSVPLHLRNAPTKLMKNLGYGKDYKYPHTNDASGETYLPEQLRGKKYYHATVKKK